MQMVTNYGIEHSEEQNMMLLALFNRPLMVVIFSQVQHPHMGLVVQMHGLSRPMQMVMRFGTEHLGMKMMRFFVRFSRPQTAVTSLLEGLRASELLLELPISGW